MAGTAGSVAPVFRGEYSASNTYDFYHSVTYGNKLYFCKQDGTKGHTPSGKTDDYWFMSLDGTFADAASLGGETATQWQTKLDNIQTTSTASLSTPGWYRVAKYTATGSGLYGNRTNTVELTIKRAAGESTGETIKLLCTSRHNKQQFYVLYADVGSVHYITKARYTYDGVAAYLEIYYDTETKYTVTFGLDSPWNGGGMSNPWKAITPTLTEETVEGVTVTTTYDIPANASPVTDLDLAQVDGTTALNTSILEKAVELENGFHVFRLGGSGYTGGDLPATLYAYGLASVFKWSGNIVVELHGHKNIATNRKAVKYYTNDNGIWSDWFIGVTTSDLTAALAGYLKLDGSGILKNYLQIGSSAETALRNLIMTNSPRNIGFILRESGTFQLYDGTNTKEILKSTADGTNTFNGTATGNLPLDGGGIVSHAGNSVMYLENTISYATDVYIGFKLAGTSIGWMGYLNGAPTAYVGSKPRTLLHTGNCERLVRSESAPTDTNAVWLDPVNKTIKTYIDGAWTAMA